MAKRGPKGPRKPFDVEKFKSVATIFRYRENFRKDMAYVLGCSPGKLDRDVKMYFGQSFKKVIKQFQVKGRMNITNMVWEKAQQGYWPAIKHLSDNYLGTTGLVTQLPRKAVGRTDFGDMAMKDPMVEHAYRAFCEAQFEVEEAIRGALHNPACAP